MIFQCFFVKNSVHRTEGPPLTKSLGSSSCISSIVIKCFKILSTCTYAPSQVVNLILKAPIIVLNRHILRNRYTSNNHRKPSRVKRGMWENIHLFRLKKLSHNACLIGGTIIMQKAQVSESCFRPRLLKCAFNFFKTTFS